MRVPDEVLGCVVFLYYQSAIGPRQAGTGFFFSMPHDVPRWSSMYVVTAKHVIEGIRQHSTDATVYLRVNSKQDGAIFVKSDLDAWITDEGDHFLDVAALQWMPSQEVFAFAMSHGRWSRMTRLSHSTESVWAMRPSSLVSLSTTMGNRGIFRLFASVLSQLCRVNGCRFSSAIRQFSWMPT